MAEYSTLSAYFQTPQTSWYLKHWTEIKIPSLESDSIITLSDAYIHRPDLLSHKLYGTVDLWWVFSVRNPDVIKDPIYDMEAGVEIAVPSFSDLMDILNA